MAGVAEDVIAEQCAKMQPQTPEDDFEVWPENWQCLNVFLALDSDWNISIGFESRHYNGIHTQAIESAFNIFKIPHKQRIEYLAKLKAMQYAALPLLNKPKD